MANQKPTWTLSIPASDVYAIETHTQASRLLCTLQDLSEQWRLIVKHSDDAEEKAHAAYARDQLYAALEAAGVTLWPGE